MVIFATAETLRFYAVPRELKRALVVARDFYVQPLIPLLTMPEHFLLLRLQAAAVRLVRVLTGMLVEMKLGVEQNLNVFRAEEVPVRDRSFHSNRAGSQTGRGSVVPHGNQHDEKHEEFERYVQKLARRIDEKLAHETAPLLIVGNENLRSHLLQYLKYDRVVLSDKDIELSEPTIGASRDPRGTWQLCEDIVERQQRTPIADEVFADYLTLTGTGRTMEEPQGIEVLAEAGQIRSLLLGPDFPAVSEEGELSHEQTLSNAAVIATLRHKGRVVQLPEGTPFHHTIGAILRTGAYAPLHPAA